MYLSIKTVGLWSIDLSAGLVDLLAVAPVPAASVELMTAPVGFAGSNKMAGSLGLWQLSKRIGLLICLSICVTCLHIGPVPAEWSLALYPVVSCSSHSQSLEQCWMIRHYPCDVPY